MDVSSPSPVNHHAHHPGFTGATGALFGLIMVVMGRAKARLAALQRYGITRNAGW